MGLFRKKVANDNGYVPLVVNASRSFPHSLHHRVCYQINTMGTTNGEGSVYPSVAPEFTPWFSVGFLLLNLQFYVYVLQIIDCPFSFGHCVVCSSSIYGLWLPLWYLQTLLPVVVIIIWYFPHSWHHFVCKKINTTDTTS